jgi:hypothetical protein
VNGRVPHVRIESTKSNLEREVVLLRQENTRLSEGKLVRPLPHIPQTSDPMNCSLDSFTL